MRLVGRIKGAKEAYAFHAFLEQEGIESSYEQEANEDEFAIWIVNEDHAEKTRQHLEAFQQNPDDPRFRLNDPPPPRPMETSSTPEDEEEITPPPPRIKRMRAARSPLTRFIIMACVLLFFWNSMQHSALAKKKSGARFAGLTPLFIDLAYDVPKNLPLLLKFFEENPVDSPEDLNKLPTEAEEAFKEIEEVPVWVGLYGIALGWPETEDDLKAPMFYKISQGQVWRLFTPVLLHGSILHILFNMLWLWLLGKQIEERIRKSQYLAITVIIAIVSNTAQYLMSGPLFIGYSGIVCGLAGFIWMRQRMAPWEGYPLQRGTIAFLAIFILAMLAIQVASFIFIRYGIANFSMNIANTAHLSGAITGMILGRIPFLSKGAL